MASISDDLSVALIQLAACYLKSPTTELEKSKSEIAVRNATLFGKILSIAGAYIRAPNDVTAMTALSDNLSNTPLSRKSLEKCTSLITELKHDIQTDSSILHKHFPGLSNVRWRVDITISSSVMYRVLEPNLIMELELTDGQKVTFELSISNFHKLRYTVASLLKEMDLMNHRMNALKV